MGCSRENSRPREVEDRGISNRGKWEEVFENITTSDKSSCSVWVWVCARAHVCMRACVCVKGGDLQV